MGNIYLSVNYTGNKNRKEGTINTSCFKGNNIRGNWVSTAITLEWTRSVNTYYEVDTYVAENGVSKGSVETSQGYVTGPTRITKTAYLSDIGFGSGDSIYKMSHSQLSADILSPSNSITFNVTSLTAESPKNIVLTSGKKIYEPISFKFDMVSNNSCSVEVWQNDYKIYAKNIGTTRTFAIPAGTIKTTQSVTIKINSSVTLGGISSTSTWTTYNLSGLETLIAEKPTAIALTSEPIINKRLVFEVATPNTIDLIDFELYQGETLKYSSFGSSSRTFATLPNLLTSISNIKAKARTQITIAGISSTSEWLEVDILGLEDHAPRIYSLEPNDIDVNGLGQIKASWYSQFQEYYTLSIRQDGIEKLKYTGTTEKEVAIPPYILTLNKNVELFLSISNSTLGMGDNRTSTFYAYGKPSQPVLEQTLIYNTSKPTFRWTATGQTGYRVTIQDNLGNLIEDSMIINTSNAFEYTCKTSLSNNSTYTVSVSIKNRYDIWCEPTSKTFDVSYAELPKPSFNLQKDALNGTITLVINNTYDPSFLDCEVYRKKANDHIWQRIAYKLPLNYTLVDYAVASGTVYQYKVRANDKQGGISESSIKEGMTSVKDFQFINIEDYTQRLTLVKTPKIKYSLVNRVVSTIYAGNSKPVLERGAELYKVLEMSFEVESDELEEFNRLVNGSDILLFRDRRRNFAYGHITSNITIDYIEHIELFRISFTFTELAYNNSDIYTDKTGAKRIYNDNDICIYTECIGGGEDERNSL